MGNKMKILVILLSIFTIALNQVCLTRSQLNDEISDPFMRRNPRCAWTPWYRNFKLWTHGTL